jgi:hypothetical protein
VAAAGCQRRRRLRLLFPRAAASVVPAARSRLQWAAVPAFAAGPQRLGPGAAPPQGWGWGWSPQQLLWRLCSRVRPQPFDCDPNS